MTAAPVNGSRPSAERSGPTAAGRRRRPSVVPRYVRPPAERFVRLRARTWTAIVVVLLLIGVELYARFGAVSSLDLIPVTEMTARSVELLGSSEFVLGDLLRTLAIVLAAFGLSAVLGVGIAYAMARFAWCRAALQPYLNVFYAIPTFALYPVLVVLFGTGAFPIIMLAVVFSVVVVIANALVGFDGVPPIVDKLSKSLDLKPMDHLRLVLLPSALPDIVAGLKLGLAYAVIAVLASEFILATEGLGNTVADAYASFNTPDMYAGVLFVAAFALAANLLLGGALARFDWRRR